MFLLQGSASHIAIHTTEIMTLRKKINELYAHHTGQSASFIGRHSTGIDCYCIILAILSIGCFKGCRVNNKRD